MREKRLKNRTPVFLSLVFGLFLSICPAYASVSTDTAMTPAEGQTIFRSLVKAQTKSGDKSGRNQKMTVVENRNVVVYGIRDGTALFTVIPVLYKELEANNASGGRTSRDAFGLGDVRVFLNQRIWRKDALGRTDRLGILGGLEFPTGDSSEEDGLGKLPRSVQLGSGSWDPFVGAVFTHQEHLYEFSQDLVYKFNTPKGSFSFGDELSHNTAFSIRIWPKELPETGVPSQIQAVIELNGLWAQRNKVDGEKVDGSGGYTLYLSPGVQWVGSWWILEGAVQFPVVQNLGRDEIRNDPIYLVGLRIAF